MDDEKVRARILQIVERNPGCTVPSVQSEIRSEFGVTCRSYLKVLEAEGLIQIRNGFNIYLV